MKSKINKALLALFIGSLVLSLSGCGKEEKEYWNLEFVKYDKDSTNNRVIYVSHDKKQHYEVYVDTYTYEYKKEEIEKAKEAYTIKGGIKKKYFTDKDYLDIDEKKFRLSKTNDIN